MGSWRQETSGDVLLRRDAGLSIVPSSSLKRREAAAASATTSDVDHHAQPLFDPHEARRGTSGQAPGPGSLALAPTRTYPTGMLPMHEALHGMHPSTPQSPSFLDRHKLVVQSWLTVKQQATSDSSGAAPGRSSSSSQSALGGSAGGAAGSGSFRDRAKQSTLLDNVISTRPATSQFSSPAKAPLLEAPRSSAPASPSSRTLPYQHQHQQMPASASAAARRAATSPLPQQPPPLPPSQQQPAAAQSHFSMALLNIQLASMAQQPSRPAREASAALTCTTDNDDDLSEDSADYHDLAARADSGNNRAPSFRSDSAGSSGRGSNGHPGHPTLEDGGALLAPTWGAGPTLRVRRAAGSIGGTGLELRPGWFARNASSPLPP